MAKFSSGAFAIALGFTALFANGADAADTVRIGYSIAKTGLYAVATPVQQQALELWRDQLNEKGGLDIGGRERRKIEFVTYDDQSQPAKAAQIYAKLINEDHVDLLLSPWGTAIHIAVAPVVEKYKFPVVGTTASSSLVRELNVHYMWFIEPPPEAYGEAFPKLLSSIGAKRVAIMAIQLPFSLETKKFLIPALQKEKIEVVFNQEYPPDIKDFTGLLSSIKAVEPDAVLGFTYPADSILYLNTARELKFNVPFQSLLVGPTEPFFFEKFGENLNGIVTMGHWAPSQLKWPQAKEFFDAYTAKFKQRPDYLDSSLAYMGAQVLEQAVAKVGLDKEKLRETIATDTFPTIGGAIHWDQSGVNTGIPAGFLQVQKGDVQIIWPPQIETAKYEPKKGWAQ